MVGRVFQHPWCHRSRAGRSTRVADAHLALTGYYAAYVGARQVPETDAFGLLTLHVEAPVTDGLVWANGTGSRPLGPAVRRTAGNAVLLIRDAEFSAAVKREKAWNHQAFSYASGAFTVSQAS